MGHFIKCQIVLLFYWVYMLLRISVANTGKNVILSLLYPENLSKKYVRDFSTQEGESISFEDAGTE